jgi:ATP-dependent Clp protease adaptor protein ClpS
MEGSDMSIYDPDLKEDVAIESEDKVTEPPMFKVLLHNDDYTTKAFVVDVLMAVFHKSFDEAAELMWHVHRNGTGVCGVYPYEMAETKVKTVTLMAREQGFPLKTSVEEE